MNEDADTSPPDASTSDASALSLWEALPTLAGDAVALTDDAIYVGVSPHVTCYACPKPYVDCRPCDNAGDGSLVRYSRDFSAAPTVIASNLSVEFWSLYILGEHALVNVERMFSLRDGSETSINPNYVRDPWHGLSVDNDAAYVRANGDLGATILQITPTEITDIHVAEPSDVNSSREFTVADGQIYMATDCLNGNLIDTCERSGIYRVPLAGGKPDPARIVGGYVGRLAVRQADLYFTVGWEIYHSTLGADTAPPTVVHRGLVELTGMTAIDDGVLLSVTDPYNNTLTYASRDGSHVETLATIENGWPRCTTPKWNKELAACAAPGRTENGVRNANSKVYLARRK